ncbi:MAG: hypothetical protein L0Y70_18450, partial [Gemmataceae bacterium]|nr:hypothetical protein [Gemmataceae bacterium]
AFCSSTRALADAPAVRELRVQRVGETTYFHVVFDEPAGMAAMRIAPGPYPLVERRGLGLLPIDKITKWEESAYREFREEYMRLWRQFFDPVGMRFSLGKERVRAEVYILPLINNTQYRELRLMTGGGPLQFDPATISPKALVQYTMHMANPGFFGEAFGNWSVIRLDDSPAFAKLAQLWLQRDLRPEERALTEVEYFELATHVPLTFGVAIGKKESFASLLKMVVDFLGPNSAEITLHKGVQITKLWFGPGSPLVSQIFERELKTPFREVSIYHAEIDGGWYASFYRAPLEDLIERRGMRRNPLTPNPSPSGRGEKSPAETVPINTSLHIAPRAAVQAGAALRFYVEWESHKRALPNNAAWYAQYRSGLFDAKTPASVQRAQALKFLGFIPVSPDDAAYVYDARLGEVVNERHGSLRRPKLHSGLAEEWPLKKLLDQYPEVRADMRFREDGLHATVTLQRK